MPAQSGQAPRSSSSRNARKPHNAAASARARAKWARAVEIASQRRTLLLQAVAAQYDALDNLLRFKGSNVGKEIATIIRFYGDRMLSGSAIASLVSGTGATLVCAFAPPSMYQRVRSGLDWLLSKACEQTARAFPTATGAISSAGTWVKRKSANAMGSLPLVAHPTYQIVRLLPRLLGTVPEAVVRTAAGEYAKLLDVPALKAAVARHSDAVAQVLHGRDVSLKPLVIDVAKSMNVCIVEAILRNMSPAAGFKPPPISQLAAECGVTNKKR